MKVIHGLGDHDPLGIFPRPFSDSISSVDALGHHGAPRAPVDDWLDAQIGAPVGPGRAGRLG